MAKKISEGIATEAQLRVAHRAEVILGGKGRRRELLNVIRENLTWAKKHRDESEWRFAGFARALAEFVDDRHFEGEGFRSANDWLEAMTKEYQLKSRTTLWNAYWIGSRLSPYIAEPLMKEIGKSKLYLLANATRDDNGGPKPEMVERARNLSVEEFKASIKRPLLSGEVPEDQDLVELDEFWVSRQEARFIEQVLELGRVKFGLASRHRALVTVMEIAHREWVEEVEGNA